MANLSKDIQCAGSDTRPPMLNRTDFASWQQRIRLYCRGKENGVNILKSIDEGPFQMVTFRETLAEGTEGNEHSTSRAAKRYLLSYQSLHRCKGHIGQRKDAPGSETIRDRGPNYDQLYAYLKQHEAHANENKMMLD
ncbi:hypothetical protein Tco_0046352 [Tanacetum coccineum]